MTKLEEYAKEAMGVIIANHLEDYVTVSGVDYDQIAKDSFKIAQAMIKESEKLW